MHIISGLYKNRPIQTPKGNKTRPTSSRLRESLFNICQCFDEGFRFLDLFAGSGAMGLEALSRGASSAVFVDNSKESIRSINMNIQAFDVKDQSEVIYGDVFESMQKLAKRGDSFDIIYADPPYELYGGEEKKKIFYSEMVLATLDRLIDLNFLLLRPSGFLFVEEAAKALTHPNALKHLQLKNSRKMGRSALEHYIFKN